MNVDLDTRIIPDREMNDDDCARIWQACLALAASDATNRTISKPHGAFPTQKDQEEARAWLTSPSFELDVACTSLGRASAMLNQHWRAIQARSWRP